MFLPPGRNQIPTPTKEENYNRILSCLKITLTKIDSELRKNHRELAPVRGIVSEAITEMENIIDFKNLESRHRIVDIL